MSIASQATEQKFPFSYEAVFNGLVKVISDEGMEVKSRDKIIGRITATSGASAFSWGERLTFIVEKIDENSTNIRIESSLKFGASLAGSHRHQENFDEVISALSQYLCPSQTITHGPSAGGHDKAFVVFAILLAFLIVIYNLTK